MPCAAPSGHRAQEIAGLFDLDLDNVIGVDVDIELCPVVNVARLNLNQ